MTADDFPGTVRFEIVRKLGAGGAGVVYEAIDREQSVRVALKTLRRIGPDALLRFKNEFRSLQDLQHPNLVTLGELFEERGQWFLTMEFVEGTDFLAYVQRPDSQSDDGSEATFSDPTAVDSLPRETSVDANSGAFTSLREPSPSRFPPFDAHKLKASIVQLARGLSALHAAGKIHRDVKPSNVLVTEEGRVVILDFGLVLETAHANEEIDLVVGTLNYMAPEQAAGLSVTPRADGYAVGVVLYRALTGRFPFEGSRRRAHEAVRPSELVDGVPPELDALTMDLLQRAPEARPSTTQILKRLDANPSFDIDPLGTSGSVPSSRRFVGREVELALLREAFDETLSGGTVAMIVTGDSGVGKSTLVRRFGELVAEECGAVVLSGRCYERESLPYKGVDGVIDALARYLGRLPHADAAAFAPARAQLLAKVFPVLRRVKAIADPPLPKGHEQAIPGARVDPREQRAQVFAEMRALLANVASALPLVLCIDDLQWSDTDSLSLLRELLRPPDAPPLLLLATARPTHASGDRRSRADIATEPKLAAFEVLPGDVRTLSLDRLSPREAQELAGLLLARAPWSHTGMAHTIADEAAGHPLFIDELVRHAIAQGHGLQEGVHLEQALVQRVSRLEAGMRGVLTLLCVAGAPLRQETASRALSMEFSVFARALRHLGIANLVRTSGTKRADLVEPYHDRVRGAVTGGVDEDARRECHRRIAMAIEIDEDADVDALAAHWRAAGEPKKAWHYALLAAERAAHALAFDRARHLYRVALTLGVASPEEERRVRIRLGGVLTNVGRCAEAAQAYLAAAVGAEPDEAIALKRYAAENFLMSGHFDEGVATLRGVLGAMGMEVAPSTASAVMSLLIRRGQLRIRGFKYTARGAASVPAEDLARIDSLGAIAKALGMVDTLRGADFQTRHLILALDAGEPARIARALALEAGYHATGGSRTAARTAEIVALSREAANIAQHPFADVWAHAGFATAAFLEGRWAESFHAFERSAEAIRGRSGMQWEMDSANFYQLAALMHLGQLREIGRRLPRLIEEAEVRGDRYALTHLRTGLLSIAWLARHDPEGARREADSAIERWSHQGTHVPHFMDVLAKVQIDLYEGKAADAELRVDATWPRLRDAMLLRVQFIRIKMLELRARTRLAVAASLPSVAREGRLGEVETAARQIEKESTHWGSPLAALLRGAAAHLRGDGDGARAHWQRAASAFDGAAMELHAASARYRIAEMDGDGLALGAARAWFEGQGVTVPSRMVEMIVPLGSSS